jgi:uncharacterized protein YlxP (DUF503 family)
MIVGILMMELHLPLAQNLKEKRKVLQSVLARAKNRYNISIAELDHRDKWQRSLVGVSCVNSEVRAAENLFYCVRGLFEENGEIVVIRETRNYYPLENE